MPNRSHSLTSVYCGLLLLAATCVARAESVDVDSLVDGVIGRWRAVNSASLEYSRTRGFEHLNKSIVDRREEGAFFESHWKVRTRDPEMVLINYHDCLLECLYQWHGGDKILPSVWIRPSKRPEEASITLPRFAGTLWYESTASFIASKRPDAKWVGSQRVGGVDAEVVEWVITPANRRAFHVVTPQMNEGGILRLAIAPRLGCCLPMIEYLTMDRRLQITFESNDFKQVTDGIYWPSTCKRQSYLADGGKGHYETYIFSRLKSINQPIADDEFVLSLPDGSYINDVRPGANSAVYIVGENFQSVMELPGNLLLRKKPPRAPSGS